MRPTDDATDEITRLIGRTLVSYNLKPDDDVIEALTEGLVAHGQRYVAMARRAEAATPRVAHALADWDSLTTRGPGPEPLARWNHARSLARVLRTLHEARVAVTA
ncbi:DUF6415 family natural product biosynthesis protein [Streptomyces sp. NPDC090022]|uniref:DUF6415 family natural product biosynthesis protein n=1 Tax=Streptomyces sp. NPDC090022 TaxID=3365920 RepID=UPI00381597AD